MLEAAGACKEEMGKAGAWITPVTKQRGDVCHKDQQAKQDEEPHTGAP